MDIRIKSLIELKAMVFDESENLSIAQNNLNALHIEINKRKAAQKAALEGTKPVPVKLPPLPEKK